MEVTCGRCKANYEFDDALLSAEGTTVRCTRCGYEFDVFPREELADEWSVWLSGASEPLKYDALADLERDIIAGKIGPDDRLAKGGEEPRRLSSISELGPLLRQHALSRVPPPRDLDRSLTRTRLGLPALGDKLPPGAPRRGSAFSAASGTTASFFGHLEARALGPLGHLSRHTPPS
ncbi:MAG: hypothetical protein B6A08_12700 [Sorangiineae bacterium NIC37A_2]|nr:MAG: hypothetical protein B6A08_12700 [Sorangiineae bacterium NIC37A_2]